MCCWKCVCSSFTYLVYHSSEGNIHTGWKGLSRLLLYKSLGACIPAFQKACASTNKVMVVQECNQFDSQFNSQVWNLICSSVRSLICSSVHSLIQGLVCSLVRTSIFSPVYSSTRIYYADSQISCRPCPALSTCLRETRQTANANDTLLYNTHGSWWKCCFHTCYIWATTWEAKFGEEVTQVSPY